MSLNEQQQKAVDTLEGPLMILAGAGSGKTRVIIHRIANLINHGVRPENILAVTFTNKAAGEMRERVAGLLTTEQAELVTVSTFHAFCMSVLRRHISRLGYSRHFGIATEGYQRGLIKEIISENHYTGPGCDAGLWLSYISNAKAAMKEPDDLLRSEKIIRAQDVANVYRIYQTKLAQMDLVDFDDLLTLTVKLWQQFPDVLENYRRQFHYLLIDEYQDTNTVQLKIMVMLAGERKNICVVGDDDQSIYGWRGADITNILDFEKYFPGATVIRLEQNYRSTNTILKAANKLIAHNVNRRPKALWSNQGDGEPILAVLCENETDEAAFVCDYIKDAARKGQWDDFAVLFRAGHQSRVLEEVFHRKGIPYVLVGANSFFKRKEVLDAIAFLKLVANPKDDLAMLQVINVPPRGVGDVTIEKLREIRKITSLSIHDAADSESFRNAVSPDIRESVSAFNGIIRDIRSRVPESGAVYPIAEELLRRIGYIDGLVRMYKPREDAMKRRDNVREFLASIAEYDETKHNKGSLQDFIEQFDLKDANDRRKNGDEAESRAVTLMTVHASKGLEFPNVFVVGFEQGLFPHQTALDEGNVEEERRLCYVAITRAKERLLLTYATRRRVMNQVVAKRPSHFLDELPREVVEFSNPRKAIKPATLEETENYLEQMRKMFGG